MRTRMAICGLLLLLPMVGLVGANPAAAAETTNVTFKNDVAFGLPVTEWPVGDCVTLQCDHRVLVSAGVRLPRRQVFVFPIDLGPVEHFQVDDGYFDYQADYFWGYLFHVSVSSGSGPQTVTLTELHNKTYSSSIHVSVECIESRPMEFYQLAC